MRRAGDFETVQDDQMRVEYILKGNSDRSKKRDIESRIKGLWKLEGKVIDDPRALRGLLLSKSDFVQLKRS